MADVSVGTAETKLELSCISWSQDGRAELLRAGLVSAGLAVEREAYEYQGYGALAAFFEQMAADWRGWPGERTYQSLEGDLQIVASHDGHVRLAVRLNHFAGPVWRVRADVVVQPGEDLAAAALEVRRLVDGTRSR